MNGPHDMGGFTGFGPVLHETDEPVWHYDWEPRAFALVLAQLMIMPDVLIVDERMPGLDGPAVVDAARRIVPGLLPPVLLLSSVNTVPVEVCRLTPEILV